MNRPLYLRPVSLLLGAAFCLICVVAMAQVTVQPLSGPMAAVGHFTGIGNPHPRDMVQLTTATTGAISLASGAEYEVFSVPNNRWLVLVPNHSQVTAGTPFSVQTAIGNFGELYESTSSALNYKATAGTQTGWIPSTGESVPSSSVVGWTFAPGSRVIIRNQGGMAGPLQYNFFGYMVAD